MSPVFHTILQNNVSQQGIAHLHLLLLPSQHTPTSLPRIPSTLQPKRLISATETILFSAGSKSLRNPCFKDSQHRKLSSNQWPTPNPTHLPILIKFFHQAKPMRPPSPIRPPTSP